MYYLQISGMKNQLVNEKKSGNLKSRIFESKLYIGAIQQALNELEGLRVAFA